MSRLVVGPGPSYARKEGDVLLDIVPRYCDIVFDLEDILSKPLPFADNTFDALECFHVLEHIGNNKIYAKIIMEFYRVLKLGGTLHIKVPHKNHRDAWECYQHVRYFVLNSFINFTSKERYRKEMGLLCNFEYILNRVNYDPHEPKVEKEVEVLLKKIPMDFEV